jgi:hypothetical protein
MIKGRLLELPANIRLGWNLLTLSNPPAFCSAELVKAVKKFYDEG